MNIVVHRGTHQIGGCITEISTDKTRIFIDMGAELPDVYGNTVEDNISITGVTCGDRRCDAVFFTHYHGDHIGKIADILPGVPLYMGEAAKEIFAALQDRINKENLKRVSEINTFKAAQSIIVGDIRITPFMVDHSAYDAYMFLIEADGKRVLHTGDFRTHGFRGKGVFPMLKKYVGTVDVLITEGTMFSRDNPKVQTECELLEKAKKLFSEYKYVFAVCSSTNIDRLASFNKATPRGKYFLCDFYQKTVLDIAKKYAAKYSDLYAFQKVQTIGSNLYVKMEACGFVMPVRCNNSFSAITDEYKKNHNSDTLVVYSMWDGYLKQPGNRLHQLIDGFQNVQHLHTSGHATESTILQLCSIVNPKKGIITIHSEIPSKLSSFNLPNQIIAINDGETFCV